MKLSPAKEMELKLSGRYGKILTKRVSKRAQRFDPTIDDLSKEINVEVICNKCKYKVATYKSRAGDDIRRRNWDIHYFYEATRKKWKGCRGININPKTTEITFECCCDNDNRSINADETFGPNKGFEYRIVK